MSDVLSRKQACAHHTHGCQNWPQVKSTKTQCASLMMCVVRIIQTELNTSYVNIGYADCQ